MALPLSTLSRFPSPTLHVALAALHAGISVVPIRSDGSKQPALSGWKRYQERLPLVAEVEAWFGDPEKGLALVTGPISGNLIAIDFDDEDMFSAWLKHVLQDQALTDLYDAIARGYEEITPKGGRHLLFRCSEIAGNQKLAQRRGPDAQRLETLAETRERGGIIIVDPSHGGVHPSGLAYVRVRGSVTSIRTIDAPSRARLYESIREFDQTPPVRRPNAPSALATLRPLSSCPGSRPGDLFNRDPAVTWESLLQPHGWELVRMAGGEGFWRRPGKEGPGVSATTNYAGSGLLYVFSTSTCFEPERGYSKFDVYTHLSHGGDYTAAARALALRGYANKAGAAQRSRTRERQGIASADW